MNEQPQSRPGLFTVGMFWSYWRNELLPERYRENPREYDRAQMDLVKEAGGTGIPVGLAWCMIEPEQGRYDWDAADAQVEDAAARDLDMVAYIGHTPDWAVPEPPAGEDRLDGHRTPPDPRFEAEFVEYCRAVAERYRGRVDKYVFWNEPNGCSWINNGCSNSESFPLYTRWLKLAYTALKEGNPEAVVAAGALDYNAGVPEGWRYIQGIYDEGGGEYFDAVDIHPYAPQGVNWQAIRDTRRVLVENGHEEKELWICEYGWQDASDPEAVRYLREFLDEIRKDEYRYITHARYLVVTDLNEGYYGLTDIDLNPRPLFQAFREMPKECLPAGSARSMNELIARGGGSARNAGGAELDILMPKEDCEYGERLVLRALIPEQQRACDCPVDYRWSVDGVEVSREAVCSIEERPAAQKSVAIRLEASAGEWNSAVERELCIHPFETNSFAIRLRRPEEGFLVPAEAQVTLTTRVLNKTSHDLSFLWKVNGYEVMRGNEEFSVFTFVPSAFAGGKGAVGVEVECVNAGLKAADAVTIRIA